MRITPNLQHHARTDGDQPPHATRERPVPYPMPLTTSINSRQCLESARVLHFDKDIQARMQLRTDPNFAWGPEKILNMEQKSIAASARRNEHSTRVWCANARICIGKNISLLEISEVILQLYQKFDFHFVYPEQPWHTSWFVKPKL
ncbi:cytochrome P450 [Penicillium longicatenatum]|nr:cytochrome P450 [Penicillium longicatenatum]